MTLADDLEAPVDSTWTVRRLHYVRLESETEEGQVDAEARLTRPVRVIELPAESAGIETGEQPVYLYRFLADYGGEVYTWRFTSYWEDLLSGEETFLAKAINHGALSRSTKADREQVQIEALYDPDNPLALFVPFALPVPLRVEILEVSFPGLEELPQETPELVFSGEIDQVEITGDRLAARCNSFVDAIARKVPSMQIQGRCPYQTFEASTCKLTRGDWQEAGSIDQVAGRLVRVSGLASDRAADWFAWGALETGAGDAYEVRTIMRDSRVDASTHELTLNAPLLRAEVGQSAILLPGDDHRAETCANKFSNFANYGGAPFVPGQNLSIQAISATPSTGGKK